MIYIILGFEMIFLVVSVLFGISRDGEISDRLKQGASFFVTLNIVIWTVIIGVYFIIFGMKQIGG